MNFSDDESLEGLTQVPSQKRDFDGNFKLRDPNDLVDCSGNAQADFDEFAALFMEPEEDIHVSQNSATEKNDISADLFPTPPDDNAAFQQAENVVKDCSVRDEVLKVCISAIVLFNSFLCACKLFK